ncbi:MAG: Dolichyl-phosphate-mannose-protein mannosyltransferase, partial [Frankiales bacterium]|nr:Dolichyl-phosphate-mannose-protein mannosyltransferase [Frankiales bacterium]
MSRLDYALGAVACLVVVAALVSAAISLRRRLLPGWHGAGARLGELVIGTSCAVVLLELLGLVSLLRRPAIVVAALLLAAGGHALARGRADSDPPPVGAPTSTRWQVWAATAAVAAVAAQWLESVRAYLQHGNERTDSLHYHLTFAAHFAQDHSILPVYRLDNFGVATWYPLNSELLQGAGMALLGSSGLTLVVDFLSLAGVLLAAWVLAAPFRAGPAALVATCLLLVALGPTYAGAGFNDWISVWPLLAGFALLTASRGEGRQLTRPVILLVGLAGGLAIGSKLTVLAPAVVLLVLAVALRPGDRWRSLGLCLSGFALTGGYWYARNLVVVGNPVPTTRVGIGPLHLPKPATPVLDQYDQSVVHYLTDGSVIREFFRPALHAFFGPLWVVTVLLIAAGLALALLRLRQDRAVLGLALAALLSGLVYLVTPTGAGGVEGKPVLFGYNLRYALFAFVAGLLLLVIGTARTRLAPLVMAGLLGLLTVALGRNRAWASGWWKQALLLIAVLALLGTVLTLWERLERRVLLAAGLVGAVAAVIAAVPVDQRLERYSYTNAAVPRDVLFSTVRGETGQRVGVVGAPFQYPL